MQVMPRFIPKIKLVICDGKEPRSWIRKCIKYFEVYSIHDEQKMSIASLFLVDRVDPWYHNWIQRDGAHAWVDFERELCLRFGEEGLADVIEKLVKSRQEGSIGEYQGRFEDIRIRVERVMPNLGEGYFMSAFVGGLRHEIRLVVRMLRPNNLANAFQIAKFQEQFFNSTKKTNTYFRSASTNFKPNSTAPTISNPFETSPLQQNFPHTSKPVNSEFTALPNKTNSLQKTLTTH